MTTDYESLAVDLEELGRNCGLPGLANAARKIRALGVATTGIGPIPAAALRVTHIGRAVTATDPHTSRPITGELSQVSHWDGLTVVGITDQFGTAGLRLNPGDTVQVHD